MLFLLKEPLAELWPGFYVLQYITFRSAGAAATGLIASWLLARSIIPWLKRIQFAQTIRNDGPPTHLDKQGTPTMGGVLILGTTLVAVLLWGRLDNRFVYYLLAILVGYGILGFIDDWLNVRKQSTRGVSVRRKLAVQFLVALGVAGMILADPEYSTRFYVPFWKWPVWDLGWLYLPFAALVIVGTSNAVNLTDGLDGLAIGTVLAVLVTYGVFTYVTGHVNLAEYLQMPFSPSAGELTVVVAALIGAGLGFLWYNAYPAEIFMGDVGSLSLGGTIGALSVLVKQELLLVLVGGLFVAEALSVLIQVSWFKRTGRRVFRMAPLHHHFEMLGWPETKVVARFWIIASLLAIFGVATLKLR